MTNRTSTSELREKFAAMERSEAGRGLIHEDTGLITPEMQARRDANTEEREAKRTAAEIEVRRRDREQAAVDALLQGHPTARMQRAKARISALNGQRRGRWVPSGVARPEWSPELEQLEGELEAAVRAAVASVLGPKLEAAEAELAAANRERQQIVRRIRSGR
jgi:predicted aconitase